MQVFALCLIISLVDCAACNVEIQVGRRDLVAVGGEFQFTPANITASNGTVINFIFGSGIPGNHSVTQSSFVAPCMPLAGGFDSGNIQILKEVAEPPEFSIQITDDSKPIFFYCSQLLPFPHCGLGMVGSINAPLVGNTYEKFRQVAKSVGTDPSNIGQGKGGLGQSELGAIALGRVSPQPYISIFGVPSGSPAPSSATKRTKPHHSTSASVIFLTSQPSLTSNAQYYVGSPPSTSYSSSISSTSQPSQASSTQFQSRTTSINVDAIVVISLGVTVSILAISFGAWYAWRTISRTKEKQIAREMVDAPFVMQQSPSNAERHRITEFMIREKRNMQPSNPHSVLPPAKILDRLRIPAVNVRRTERREAGNASVYLRLHEDGGPALPFSNQTEQSIIDVPPTYSTIGITHVV